MDVNTKYVSIVGGKPSSADNTPPEWSIKNNIAYDDNVVNILRWSLTFIKPFPTYNNSAADDFENIYAK